MIRRVIKLGGSLLSWPAWPIAFREWYSRQPPAVDLLVVGGGESVDQLRELDTTFGLGESACHEVALRFMTVNAHRVSRSLKIPMVSDLKVELDRPLGVIDVYQVDLLDPLTNLRGQPLSKNWSVTSDSLAAAIAQRLNAVELVLLKSTQPPIDTSIGAWGDFVDPAFPSVCSADACVQAVNLRAIDLQKPEFASTSAHFMSPWP